MTRIIAGAARGRRLRIPRSGTRPTTDRVREAMFSTLEAHCGGFAGLRVLDLYAGSGALGLESLSRGAAEVVLVESSRTVARVLQSNIEAIGLPGAVLAVMPVERFLTDGPKRGFDVVLADPPYDVAEDAVGETLRQLADGWLDASGLVVFERPRGQRVEWPRALEAVSERRYGDTVLWYGRAA